MIKMLDCTLRDGAYIVNSKFGTSSIRGIIKHLQDANVDIIECGWLKNSSHEEGTSFFHVPADVKRYMNCKKENTIYAMMIDWDRYDLEYLPIREEGTIDAIRIVFPYEKYVEGIKKGKEILEKGYKVYFQAANTLAYSDEDLVNLAKCVNDSGADSLSIVDTFGAMYQEDLKRIVEVLDKELRQEIALGLHSHNNQQLSFALSICFLELMQDKERDVIVDSSLCGMGRGAGNTTTELLANYLNKKYYHNYDMDSIMNAIDTYMQKYKEKFDWGYSTEYFIAGVYCCHVNNIAYLIDNHRTSAKDMRNIIQSLSPADRRKYDYDLLEKAYIENQSRVIDDKMNLDNLKKELQGKEVLLIAPGKTSVSEKNVIDRYISEKRPVIIFVNAIIPAFNGDYLFLINNARYEYAANYKPDIFNDISKIVLSCVKTDANKNECIINFNRVVKTGWEYFDNAVIDCLRLLDIIGTQSVAIAGFDYFSEDVQGGYADASLPVLKKKVDYNKLNFEIQEMYDDFKKSNVSKMCIKGITSNGFVSL